MRHTVIIEPGHYRGWAVVFVRIPFDKNLVAAIRELKVARWDTEMGVWYIHKQSFDLRVIYNALNKYAYVDYSAFQKHASGAGISNLENVGNVPPCPEERQYINTGNESLQKTGTDSKPGKALDIYYLEPLDHFKSWMQQKRYSQSSIKTVDHSQCQGA